MQIRLTVVDPLGPHPAAARGRAASCDVLVTAPAGTALAAVLSQLASAVSADGGASRASEAERGGTPVVLFAGAERLDAARCTLGEPPLVDGAVLSLGAPAEPEAHPEVDDAPTRLHVVAGPDAGGVHLLHDGQINVGRSGDADVPLDDPDVSRLHCAVTVTADGRVSVADLGSTNGTTLDGTRVGGRPVRFAPGALLRIGESALRLAPAGGLGARVPTVPDGEGHLRLAGPPHTRAGQAGQPTRDTAGPAEETRHGYGSAGWGASSATPGAQEHSPVEPPVVPGQGGAPRIESHGPSAARPIPGPRGSDNHDTHGAGFGAHPHDPEDDPEDDRPDARRPARRRGGLSAWARRLTGGRAEPTAGPSPYDEGGTARETAPPSGTAPQAPETWPDPAALLLTALGPGPRLWERGPGHPEALTVRLGTADRVPPDGSGLLPAVPMTADLREVGALGLAGPRARLSGLARAVLAQLAALHSPDTLEIVLISADRSRPLQERTAEWSWLGRLPHLNPAHGQDCRLLLAYDREQATARVEELLRRLDDHAEGPRGTAYATSPGPAGGATRPEGHATAAGPVDRAARTAPAGRQTAGPAAGHPQTAPNDRHTASAEPLDGAVRTPPAAPHADSPAPAAAGRAQTAPNARQTPSAEQLDRASRTVPVARQAGPSGAARPDGHAPSAGPLDRASQAAPADQQAGPAGPAVGHPRTTPDNQPPHTAPGHRHADPAEQLHDPARTAPAAPRTDSPEPPPGRPADGTVRRVAHRPSWARDDDTPAGFPGPYSVLVVDGDPGGADVREAVARLALDGPRAGIHVVCLAETEPASPASPVSETYRAACAASPVFRDCGAVALLSGDVATALRLMRVARTGSAEAAPAGPGTVATVDAVSSAWAERFARALAPLRPDAEAGAGRQARVSVPLPRAARLLDELGLARATPASLMARWADAADDTEALGGRATAVLGAGPRGPVCADLAAEGPHLLVEGPPGSGRTELLRALVASLAAAERPDRLSMVLMDGRDRTGGGGDGLRVCTDVPHVTTHLTADDPVRMREFAQSLSAELKRRAELLGRSHFAEWHAGRTVSGKLVGQRTATNAGTQSDSGRLTGQRTTTDTGTQGNPGRLTGQRTATNAGTQSDSGRLVGQRTAADVGAQGDLDTPPSSTLRLRPAAARRQTEAAPPLPRLVVVVDDLDALVSPALGSPGRPAAGSVIRALEAVAREGERLGVHLVAAAGADGRTAQSEPARRAALRVILEAPASGPDEPAAGRGRLTWADGRVTAFQGGRVTGRIPRTATLRPTVVPLEWHRMGDPPARRPVRELGNGPTDLALLASALERAAREVAAVRVPSLL
ncbi:FtsK/SpoIIIE domain-containing protein [Streptomyces sp. CC219B]|uniref:FtsK/SpoIIIE domain-containing protein n=1 Tax=Streptomyces sp. CC219B TaxID=3044574 RepID=UPI0024A84D59|nr:FtsK/SpoIIIE domain-containing protein [Streptomyces sp. CC219B]